MLFYFRTKKILHIFFIIDYSIFSIMVPLIDLESYTAEIIELYEDKGISILFIVERLKERHDLEISGRTIKSRLQK